MNSPLASPIIIIGNGRSGSTLIFEIFSTHEELGWISNYCQSYPRLPILNLAVRLFDNKLLYLRGETKQHQNLYIMNRILPRPTEAYPFWEHYVGEKFSYEYLLETLAGETERQEIRNVLKKILKYQGKGRLVLKITGPSRICFLKSIFPDALFVHIIRDGRAVVNSLLNVKFWKEKGGYDYPFWRKGFKEEYEAIWLASGKDPIVLAALQWRNIIEIAREESKALSHGQYHEVFYENFFRDPHKGLTSLYETTGLHDSDRAHNYIALRTRPKDMNYKFKDNFEPKTINILNNMLGDILNELGYTI